jgi:hypothetical protein
MGYKTKMENKYDIGSGFRGSGFQGWTFALLVARQKQNSSMKGLWFKVTPLHNKQF